MKKYLILFGIILNGLLAQQLVSNTTTSQTWTSPAALVLAVQDGPSPGDTLVVFPGVYSISVNIQNYGDDFNIVGSSLYHLGVNNGDSIISASPGIRLNTAAHDVHVAGLNFTGAIGVRIEGSDAHNARICSNIFTNNATASIQNQSATVTNTWIYRNLFSGPYSLAAIDAGGSSPTYIYNNTIDCGGSGNDGISASNVSTHISNNIIINSGDWGIYDAVPSFENNNLFSNNLSGSVLSGFSGLDIQPSGDHRLATDYSLQIGSAAIDSGVTIPGITDGFNGSDPDMGWMEYFSPCTASPDQPTGVIFSSITDVSIDISWSDSSNETLYQLYWSTGVKPSIPNAIVLGNTTNYTATGLIPDSLYNFWVTASNGCGLSSDGTGSTNTVDALQVASNLNTGSVYYTVQSSIDNAASGETVVVFPHTNNEQIIISKTNFSLHSWSWLQSGDNQAVIFDNSGLNYSMTLSSAAFVDIAGFSFFGSGNGGIYIEGGNNRIHNNRLNGPSGNALVQRNSFENRIYSNRIDGYRFGVFITNGSVNTHFYKNLVANIENTGITCNGGSVNTEIYNNTVISNGKNSTLSADGIEIHMPGTTASVRNNIIAHNGGNFSIPNIDFGLDVWDFASAVNAYNLYYQNVNGGNWSGGAGNAGNNLVSNPLITLSAGYEIINNSSPAYDSALVIAGTTDGFLGAAPDRGWFEFSTAAPPLIAETNNIAGATISGTNYFAGYGTNTDTNFDPVQVLINVDGSNYSPIGTGTSWGTNVNTHLYPDGNRIFSFLATNIQGLTNTWNMSMLVDNSPPVIALTNLLSNDVLTGPYIFWGTLSDPHTGVPGAWFIISNSVTASTQAISGANWGAFVNTTSFPDGNYAAYVTGTNGAGLSFSSIPIPFSINNNLFFLDVTNAPAGWIAGNYVFSGYASNSNPAFDPNTISNATNSGPAGLITTGIAWSTNIDTTLLGDGSNSMTISGVSGDGKTSNITVNFLVDNSPPTAGIINEPPNMDIVYLITTYNLSNSDLTPSPYYGYYILSNTNGYYSSNYLGTGQEITITPTDFINETFSEYTIVISTVNATGLLSSPASYNIVIRNLKFNPIVGPNPFDEKQGDNVIRISGLTKSSRVSIYTINGQLVNYIVDPDEIDGNGSLDWNTRNNEGKTVGSGVYLIYVHDLDVEPVRFKITISREYK